MIDVNDDIKKVFFSNIKLEDHFFYSLRQDYSDFDSWFMRKRMDKSKAYVLFNEKGCIQAFLYLKDEFNEDNTITPMLPKAKKLKIGTFKIDAHKTSLSQRFITIILRKMITDGYDFSYVTIYPKQDDLKKLFKKYGFHKWGMKDKEEVYYKNLDVKNNIYEDFPRINETNLVNKFLLGIYPKHHTKLFPDSKLCNENDFHRNDVSFSNTIVKSYLGCMKEMPKIKEKDLIVIYRTSTGQELPAYYNSVVTSVCTVVDTCNIKDFQSYPEFKKYIGYGTIFSDYELEQFYKTPKYPYIIRMIYNFPLNKRMTNGDLKDKLNINPEYWGCAQLTNQQFDSILEYGEVNANFIIN